MRVGAIAIVLAMLMTGCTRSTNGTSSSNASAKNGGGGGNTPANQGAGNNAKNASGGAGGGANAAQANGTAAAAAPDAHQSKSPNVGREAGVGDDPTSLQAADPQGNSGATGKPGPAQKQ